MTLQFQGVTKTFLQGEQNKDAVHDINFKLKRNSFNLFNGPAGSGKSTLISLASLIDTPTQGEIYLNGIPTSHLSDKETAHLRRYEIGIIYQRENLLPYLSASENITVPQIREDKKRYMNILDKIELDDPNRYPYELSLMEQQKTVLARALINSPHILLADEPTGELNLKDTINYLNLMAEFSDDKVIIMVSDNPALDEYFDQVFHLQGGILK